MIVHLGFSWYLHRELESKVDLPMSRETDHPIAAWPAPPAELSLAAGDVHIWRVGLLQPDPVIAACRALLPGDEIARAERFYFERDRCRFLVSHGMVRTVLGRYLALQPLGLRFGQGAKGKPDLAPEQNPLGLTFNLSHSGEFALMGVA